MKATEFEAINQNGEKVRVRYAYIPNKLEVEGRPELSVFPLNVLFVNYKKQGDKVISGTALYNPEMESFLLVEGVQYLVYTNQFNEEHQLIVAYHPDSGNYEGAKIFNKENVLYVLGRDWTDLFVQLSKAGLQNGEGCKFEEQKFRKV